MPYSTKEARKGLSPDEVELFQMLLSPNDTRLQQDTKLLLAKVVLYNVLTINEAKN